MKTSVTKFKGERLKELIKRKGISQEKFAEEFSVSTQTVSYWIREKKKPSAFNLEMLAEYFDVPQICLTGEFPLCSNAEYQKFSDKIQKDFSKFLPPPIDESIKPLFEYLNIIGKRYNTFDFDILDKSVIDDMPVFFIIKGILETKIEECFVEFGIIQAKEVENNVAE